MQETRAGRAYATRATASRDTDTACPPDRIETLVVSGGGMKGLASLGAVTALRRSGSLRHVRTIVGTSAGALVAAALATGRADKKLVDELATLPRTPDIVLQRMLTTFGVDAGDNLDAWVSKVLGGERFTFRDIHARFGVRLVVCVTNVSTRQPEYMCVDTTPGMDVELSLRMSCSVPLYFAAVRHGAGVYVDGAVSDNFPLDWALHNHGPHVLGIAFAPRASVVATSLEAFLGALVECTTRRHNVNRRHATRVLELNTGAASAFDFTMSRKSMRALYASGARQARAWLKKNQ